MIPDTPFVLKRLTSSHEMLPFDCGEDDLNEFCMNDSRYYQKELLAVTYYVDNDKDTILYFSLSNDKLSAVEVSKSAWRQIKKKIPHEKHRKDYPAVKIGRLGVNKNYRNMGKQWGSKAVGFIKQWMIDNNKTGCRFITVDALKKAVPFYQKNNFLFLGNEERLRYECDLGNPGSKGTYAMYFDLSMLLSDEE